MLRKKAKINWARFDNCRFRLNLLLLDIMFRKNLITIKKKKTLEYILNKILENLQEIQKYKQNWLGNQIQKKYIYEVCNWSFGNLPSKKIDVRTRKKASLPLNQTRHKQITNTREQPNNHTGTTTMITLATEAFSKTDRVGWEAWAAAAAAYLKMKVTWTSPVRFVRPTRSFPPHVHYFQIFTLEKSYRRQCTYSTPPGLPCGWF